tara:strand:- start:365 stop:1117 length:753 start_codon:yes stop_codon:yes gene_type:complete
MNQLVSIITPCYNSENYINDCISSVINQSYQNWEMLIVDDKSTDKSSYLIDLFSKKDKRIIPFYLNENIGPSKARNFALKKAKGRYIAFLDSDDIWLPQKIELQINFMIKNNHSFTFSSYKVCNSDFTKKIYHVNVPERINYKNYLKNTIIGCLTVMIDKEKFTKIQMPVLRSSHDMALWLDLLKKEKYAYGIQKELAVYRQHSFSNTKNKFKAALDVWYIYMYYEKLGFLYSMYNFVFYVLNALKKRIL